MAAAVSTSSGQNLVRNPGFEEGTTGWVPHYDYGTLSTTTVFPHSGTRAALAYNRDRTQAGPGQHLHTVLQPGRTYNCSGWMRVQNGNAQPIQMTIVQVDSSGWRYFELAHGVAYSNTWTRLTGTFTLNVVGTLTRCELYFEDPAAGVDLLVDDVAVTLPKPPASTPTEVVSRVGDQSVVLHWKRSDVDRPVMGYHVYRSSTSQGPFLRRTTSPVPLPSFADLEVTNGQTYFYGVSAVDELEQESTNSVPISATPCAFATDADFLDYVQRTAVDYFWYEANPLTGLVRERSRSNAVASIAATGFGLAAMGIGIDRGWLTPEQGRERVLTTLRTLWEKPQGAAATGTIGYYGWFYRLLDIDTALRASGSELSSMDTTLLLAGVLHARQYFNGDDAVEVAIRDLADRIVNRVAWMWMAHGGHTLPKGWRPESGFDASHWTGYSEALLLYLLGLGGVTAPLGHHSWEFWTNSYEWQTNYGYSYVAAHPLRAHQYAQCWIDLRHLADGYMNGQGLSYFENSRRAILAQRAYAIENPSGLVGYGPWLWGFTQSDGPGTNGYTLHGAAPALNEDGTVAPAAVAGALPFAAEYALPTLRRFYEKFRGPLWTGYGFANAFNLQTNWWDTEVVGVDQGALLLLIENYRSQRVWRRFMQSPETQRGLQVAGFVPLPFVSPSIRRTPAGNGCVVSWDAVHGRNYQVEYSHDLNVWWPSPTGFVTADGGVLSWSDAGPPATPAVPGAVHCRFYRVFMFGPP